MLAYIALAWMVRFDLRLNSQDASLVYPLDTFSMYGIMPDHDRSHLVVRDAAGVLHRVTDFRAYRCVEPLSGPDVRCAREQGIRYHYEEFVRYIEGHPGDGDIDVELINRTWQFPPVGGVLQSSDCVVAHCKVAR